MALADLIVVMNEGRIEQVGTPRDIYNKPRTEFVARFIGGNNVLPIDGRRYGMRADRLRLRQGRPASPLPFARSNIRASSCWSACSACRR